MTVLGAAGSLGDLLALPLAEIRRICASPAGETVACGRRSAARPVDGRMEVWAAGVTYERSRTARMAESEQSADIYDRVYAAERPELFFKSAAWRVSGPGAPVSVRADSSIDVPEPELAVVLNAAGAVAGYTICNDMSSRSIEGQNPLYLPQAKTYLGGCAVGPWIVPAWEIPDPYALTIELTISRAARSAWAGSASTVDAAQEDRRAGRLAVPRERVPGRGDLVDRHQPGSRAAVHAAGGRRGPHHDLRDRRRPGQPRCSGQGRPAVSPARRRFAWSSHLLRILWHAVPGEAHDPGQRSPRGGRRTTTKPAASVQSMSRLTRCQADFLADPYAVMAALPRAEQPIFFAPSIGYYVLTRYADIERVLQDPAAYSAAVAQAPLVPLVPEAQRILLAGGHKPQPSMVSLDEPEHARLRKPAARAFSMKRVTAMVPAIEATTARLLDAVASRRVRPGRRAGLPAARPTSCSP